SLTAHADASGAGVLETFETSATDSDADGAISTAEVKTTFKVHVPYFATKLNLGAGAAPFADGMHGFGLRTDGRGLVEAAGTITVNSTGGDLRFQSETGNIATLSEKNTLIGASGSVFVMGDTGVLITSAV